MKTTKILLAAAFLIVLADPHLALGQWNQSAGVVRLNNPNNRVVIGNSTVSNNKLAIRGDLTLESTNSAGETLLIGYNATGYAFLSSFNWNSGTWSDFSLNAGGGRVGIGTLNPTHTLTVNGAIRAEEVEVVPTVPPDFVFYDDYDLRPLEDVERYIDEHGHLPEIPSAEEMTAEGVAMGEMQMKLLQKIEELTLYTIAQQKALDALAQDNEALRQELATLKAQ